MVSVRGRCALEFPFQTTQTAKKKKLFDGESSAYSSSFSGKKDGARARARVDVTLKTPSNAAARPVHCTRCYMLPACPGSWIKCFHLSIEIITRLLAKAI